MRRFAQIAIVAAVALVPMHAGAATPKVDVSPDTIRCDTVIGTAGIKPALNNSSGVPLAIKVKGTLAGCTVSGPNPATILSGKFSGTLNSISSGCAGLLATTPVTGNITITWKADKTTPIMQTKSVVSAANLTGSVFNGPAGDSHGQFNLTSSGATGAFLGNDNGASSVTVAVTSQDIGLLATQCGSTGIKLINLGLGQIKVQ